MMIAEIGGLEERLVAHLRECEFGLYQDELCGVSAVDRIVQGTIKLTMRCQSSLLAANTCRCFADGFK